MTDREKAINASVRVSLCAQVMLELLEDVPETIAYKREIKRFTNESIKHFDKFVGGITRNVDASEAGQWGEITNAIYRQFKEINVTEHATGKK